MIAFEYPNPQLIDVEEIIEIASIYFCRHNFLDEDDTSIGAAYFYSSFAIKYLDSEEAKAKYNKKEIVMLKVDADFTKFLSKMLMRQKMRKYVAENEIEGRATMENDVFFYEKFMPNDYSLFKELKKRV